MYVNYSENYKNKHQNETKSAFYGQGQLTVYTACIYVNADGGVKCKNYALITLENDHSYNVSFALNDFLIKELQKIYPISAINFWCDGCASQFQNKYAFYMIAKCDNMKIECYYFEANYSKGPVDGIGGSVKHAVYRNVLSTKVIIENLLQFASYAVSILSLISRLCLWEMMS